MMEMLQRFEEGADISLDEDDGGLAEALDGVDLGTSSLSHSHGQLRRFLRLS